MNIYQCYHSCETCSVNIYGANKAQHYCKTCKVHYYPSPKIKSNCYNESEIEINWYLDSNIKEFALCDEKCKSCFGPSKNDCLSCYNDSYLFSGSCISHCPSGYFAEKINNNDDYHYECFSCYENCETCLYKEQDNYKDMKCLSCKKNYIKYKNNCYKIKNSTIKSFYDPEENNEESSCFQKFNLYIKEDFNECIKLPDKNEGYYISNNITGLLSNCHVNCLSCNNGAIVNKDGYLESMECSSCKNPNKTMIKIENNCIVLI